MFLRLLCLSLTLLGRAASARELLMLAGDSVPPYAIAAEDRGAEIDLLRAAMATQGLQLRFAYVPLARVSSDLQALNADGATRHSAAFGLPQGFPSEPYVRYQACVLGRADQPVLRELAQLRRLRVQAFQGARAEMGGEFAAAVGPNPRYSEINNQRSQMNLLLLGRSDAVVADRHIAGWHWRELKAQVELRCWIPLKDQHYAAFFRRAEDAEAFNKGLHQIRTSGEYARILARYGIEP